MPVLKANLLGKPRVKINDTRVKFPYRKVEALFYYLVSKKEVAREEVAFLLWGDMTDSKARKNLRNALYQLRKVIDKTTVYSPDRFTIKIAEETALTADIDCFKGAGEQKKLDLYRGQFLEGFLLKDAREYSAWLREERNYYQNKYIEALTVRIEELEDKQNWQQAIDYLQLLLHVDEYNEKGYRKLMRLYGERGNINRVFATYQKLAAKLKDELGIAPDPKTESLKNRLTSFKTAVTVTGDEFVGREEELSFLLNNLSAFRQGYSASSVLITGEAGIGKTTILNKACQLAGEDLLVVKTSCYSAEERYVYKPWQKILKQIKKRVDLENVDTQLPWKRIISFLFPSFLEEENLAVDILNFESIQYQSALEALIYLLSEIARQRKLVLVFENLQWCDQKSRELIRSLIRENGNNILFLCTCRLERKEQVIDFYSDLFRPDLVKELSLNRLDRKEVEQFCQMTLPDHHFDQKLIEAIYRETEGNTFFLREALKLIDSGRTEIENFMTTRSKNILRERIMSVSERARQVLNIIAIPFNYIRFDVLLKISGRGRVELIELLEELQEYNLIEEVSLPEANTVCYRFTHAKLREYIYDNLSLSRKKLIHEKIANLLVEEMVIENHRQYYSTLIYHYQHAGNKFQQLKYLIKEAEIYFHRSHELFPVVNDEKIRKDKILALNQEESRRYLEEIKELLRAVRKEGKSEYKELLINNYDMWSRYYITQGEYGRALSCVEDMIENAALRGDLDSVLSGYELQAGIAIQQEDIDFIEKSGRMMYELAKSMQKRIKMGVALRFRGISRLYDRKYRSAEEMFQQSLEIFQEQGQYTLGIAANYNYLGEIHRHQGEFAEALNYYERCIGLCEANNILCGLGVFYNNAGMVLYELGKLERAARNFRKSVRIFGQLKTIWGYSSVANSYLALLSLKKGEYHQAYDYLKTADKIISQHHKGYWLGILLRTKAEIAREMKNHQQLYFIFADYLDQGNKYCQQALSIFEKIGAPYEIELIRGLDYQLSEGNETGNED